MDGITLVTAESGVVFRYVYEVPRKIFHEWFRDLDRIEWYLEYNKKFYGHKVLSEGNVGSNRFYAAQNSNFLFPRLHYYPGGQKEPRRSLYLMENARFQFNRTMERESLGKMLRNVRRVFRKRVTGQSRELEDALQSKNKLVRFLTAYRDVRDPVRDPDAPVFSDEDPEL